MHPRWWGGPARTRPCLGQCVRGRLGSAAGLAQAGGAAPGPQRVGCAVCSDVLEPEQLTGSLAWGSPRGGCGTVQGAELGPLQQSGREAVTLKKHAAYFCQKQASSSCFGLPAGVLSNWHHLGTSSTASEVESLSQLWSWQLCGEKKFLSREPSGSQRAPRRAGEGTATEDACGGLESGGDREGAVLFASFSLRLLDEL